MFQVISTSLIAFEKSGSQYLKLSPKPLRKGLTSRSCSGDVNSTPKQNLSKFGNSVGLLFETNLLELSTVMIASEVVDTILGSPCGESDAVSNPGGVKVSIMSLLYSHATKFS